MRYTYATASMLAALATAQTFTDCNPMQKDCPNDPAMPQNWETNFTAGKDAIKGWKQTAGTLNYTSDGAQFVVAKKGDAPTIGSEAYLHFGYVEVTMKAAPGQGIISSIVLQSDNLDEVDWEWIGGVDSRVQTNYFGKGNTTTYDRMIEANVANNQNDFHTYALNWTAESLTWLVDNTPVRTLNYADAVGGKNYPQTPCNVRLGNWPGGDSDNEGTRQWAGGPVDYTKAPFTMTVKSIKVINYSPGTEYQWTDKTGDYKSIKVIDAGNTAGAPQNSAVIGSSATVSAPPLASGVNAPSATSNPAPGYGSGSPTGSSKGAATPVKGGETPCDCGVATVTMTGAPPTKPSSLCSIITATVTVTGPPPANPPPSMMTQVSTLRSPITVLAGAPGYPSGSIAVDTKSVPGVPKPSVPATGALSRPSGNATLSAPPVEFTNAANQHQAGLVIGALAGILFLAL